ncbi:DUF1643 domain-containing protein [Bacillus sp. V59.32b]|uniref:DUF1643 domain-containing protein n=1 Tax=Bacillus sp. V59.32b TaxID=1758642 RepID=UPI000E3E9BE3|nr:DUF1643 domain-containing protein [Bacillus sp. V59.32b]RFU61500.1 DUF1643 domain-containing protein [Bacillus sp. V59.32b]
MPVFYPDYVETPTECIIESVNDQISSRKLLSAKLKNNYNNKFLYIMMNPSKANHHNSDKTINKCASMTYNDLSHLKVGQFSIVNVYPFYESKSAGLNDVLFKVKGISESVYFKELFANLYGIKQAIEGSDHVLLATGGIPKSIADQKEYQFILDTIVSYVESSKGVAFLGTSKNYKGRYVLQKKYAYHICPNGNPNTIDKIKLHKVQNGQFVDIPDEKEITLTI